MQDLPFVREFANIVVMYLPTKRLIQISEKYYKTIKSVNCPSLNAIVRFNRHGWNHLLYDGTDHRRSEAQIRLRLFLFRNVKLAIQNHVGYPEISKKKVTISKKEIEVAYFEINHKLKNGKYLKVIIRKFPEGEYHYYSLRRGRK